MSPRHRCDRLLPEVHAIAPSIPVIVLTGYGTIDLAVQAIKAGAEQFLTKPLAMPVLSKLLENILESRRQKRKQLADVADASLAKTLRDAADNHGNRWKIPAVLTAETVGIFGPEAARINSLTTPHPRRTLEEPIFLTVPEMRIPTTYIACTCPWGGESYIRQTERARRLGWAVRELPTGHLPMITMPEKLGSLLTEAGNQAFSNASQQ
jgi:response regulator receiver domain-containing protein